MKITLGPRKETTGEKLFYGAICCLIVVIIEWALLTALADSI